MITFPQSLLKVQRKTSVLFPPFLKIFWYAKGNGGCASLKSSCLRTVFGTWSPMENCKDLPFAPWISIPRYPLGKKIVCKSGQGSNEISLQNPGQKLYKILGGNYIRYCTSWLNLGSTCVAEEGELPQHLLICLFRQHSFLPWVTSWISDTALFHSE